MNLPEPAAGPVREHAAAPDLTLEQGSDARPGAGATQVRQGDVLLVPVDEIPSKARPVARIDGRVILAEGEATGHAHAIRSPGASLLEEGEERYLRVRGPVTLGHEEHAPILVAPGTYRVVIQREYVPADIAPAAFRRVVD